MNYGIGTVARLTGLTTHTIRAWETRHGAVTAIRDSAGRRRYSPAEVERLTKLKRLVDLGERIGNLAQRSAEELDARLTALDTGASQPPPRVAPLRVGIYGGAFRNMSLTRKKTFRRGLRAGPAFLDESPDVDCLLVAMASVSPAVVEQLETLTRRSAGTSVILVYNFARDQDLRRLAAAGTIIVRSPTNATDIKRALDEAGQTRASARLLERVADAATPQHGNGETDRFTTAELTKIGSISTRTASTPMA